MSSREVRRNAGGNQRVALTIDVCRLACDSQRIDLAKEGRHPAGGEQRIGLITA
jgi:hypothetical protein